MSRFSEIHKWITRNKPTSVCIEAAHIYTNEEPTLEHIVSAEIGQDLGNEIRDRCGDSVPVTNMLFIDNYNPDPGEAVLDADAYAQLLGNAGFPVGIVTYEDRLELPALNIAEAVREQIDEHRVYGASKKVLLIDSERPTCNVLDAAYYIAKFSLFDFAVTVLPRSYRSQQKSVRYVLRALGYTQLPMANVYFTEDGNITVGVQS